MEDSAADQQISPEELHDQRDRVLNAIDFEIALESARQSRPGWTPWAFAGAIAILIWTLLDQIEHDEVRWSIVVTTLVLLASIWCVFDNLGTMLGLTPTERVSNTRFEDFREKYRTRRPVSAFLMSLAALSLVLLATLWPPSWYLLAPCSFLLLYVFAFAFVLKYGKQSKLSRKGFVPFADWDWKRKLLIAGACVTSAVSAISCSQMLYMNELRIADFRVASIITVLLAIGCIYLMTAVTNKRSSVLETLRRRLMIESESPAAVGFELEQEIYGKSSIAVALESTSRLRSSLIDKGRAIGELEKLVTAAEALRSATIRLDPSVEPAWNALLDRVHTVHAVAEKSVDVANREIELAKSQVLAAMNAGVDNAVAASVFARVVHNSKQLDNRYEWLCMTINHLQRSSDGTGTI